MMKLDMDNINKKELEKRLKWYNHKYGPYIEKRGLSNWKNLFRKPTLHEWTILFMLLMAGFIAWAYMKDTAQCKDTLKNIEEICIQYCSSEFIIEQARKETNKTYQPINFSQFIVKVDNSADV